MMKINNYAGASSHVVLHMNAHDRFAVTSVFFFLHKKPDNFEIKFNVQNPPFLTFMQ